MGGFAAARKLRKAMPEMRILFLSQYSQKVYAEEALQIGASGYLLKSAAASELATAIDAVVSGHTFISERVGV
jgi:DNA-binding NarL/FixJ family response regulator